MVLPFPYLLLLLLQLLAFVSFSASTGTERTEANIAGTASYKEETPKSLLCVNEVKNLQVTDHECDTCKIIFKAKSDLLQHQLIHPNKRLFICDICGKQFKQTHDLLRHQQWIHSNERPFACGACDARFKVKRALKSHSNRAHGSKANMRTDRKCQFCEKAFWTKRELDIHQSTHTGERPYMCEVCGKLFKNDAGIRKHISKVHKKDGKLRGKSQTSIERL